MPVQAGLQQYQPPTSKNSQVTQNKALRTLTGCTKSTNISHLHHETKILPIKDHLNMKGTQFLASTQNPSHPCNFMHHHPPPQRHMKRTTSLHYSEILNNIPPPPANTSLQKHIHNHIATSAIQNLQSNNILQEPPPDIHPSELTLTREMRTHLARLRCGHHPSLNQYKNRLDPTQDPQCPHCNAAPHTTQHLYTSCIPLTQHRMSFNITSTRDLWERPAEAAGYLRSIGFTTT